MCGNSILEDGTGTGSKAKISIGNRLSTSAITQTIEQQSIRNGDGFNVATERITLTTTSESALFYLKNTGPDDLILTSVFLNTTSSTGTLNGSQPTLKIYKNASQGTIISGANSIPLSNMIDSNFGASDTLNADIFYGGEGSTITLSEGFIDVPLPTRAAMTLVEFKTNVVLPRGSSYSISYQPETGSTSVDVIAGVTLIRITDEVS